MSGGVGGADQPRAPPPPTPYIGQLGVYYPYKSFFDGVLRNSSNFNGKEGWLNLVSAGGSQYIVDLAVSGTPDLIVVSNHFECSIQS